MEDLLGEMRGGDDNEVAMAHFEEEDVTVKFGKLGKVTVIEVVTDLEPITEDGNCEGTRGETKLGAEYFEKEEERGDEEEGKRNKD